MVKLGAKLLVASLAFALTTAASAQVRRHHQSREEERPAGPAATDRRDRVVSKLPGFVGQPYWLALAQCGGIYFKLNLLYTDAAVHARVNKVDIRTINDDTQKLTQAIKTASAYFDGAEHFLMSDRNVDRNEAVLIYDGLSRASGERFRTIDATLDAAKACPALYAACQAAFPKECTEMIAPTS